MKNIVHLIIPTLFLLTSCSKPKSKMTIVEGTVTDEENIPLSGVKVGVFEMSNNFTFNSYQLVTETKTDQDGYFRIETEEHIEVVAAAKTGFFDLQAYHKELIPESKNIYHIKLNRGCKVNFNLINPAGHRGMCLFVPWSSDCEFSYASECYFEKSNVKTSCFLVGGDTAEIEYFYRDSTFGGERQYLDIYCPKGNEIDVTIDYDY